VTDRAADVDGLLADAGNVGAIRRLTLFFADLVNSTALSTHVEPETYRLVVGRYREQVLCIVTECDGQIGSTKGVDCWRCSAIRVRVRTIRAAR
jgi:class 3 adenylate cyclase